MFLAPFLILKWIATWHRLRCLRLLPERPTPALVWAGNDFLNVRFSQHSMWVIFTSIGDMSVGGFLDKSVWRLRAPLILSVLRHTHTHAFAKQFYIHLSSSQHNESRHCECATVLSRNQKCMCLCANLHTRTQTHINSLFLIIWTHSISAPF